MRQRLESVRAENQRLREENAALKEELALSYGRQRDRSLLAGTGGARSATR